MIWFLDQVNVQSKFDNYVNYPIKRLIQKRINIDDMRRVLCGVKEETLLHLFVNGH